MTQTRTPHMTDYEAERRSFHLEVPEYFNFATDVIGKWASDSKKLAMLWVGQHGEEEYITFAQFAERSSRSANAFAKLGIQKSDDQLQRHLPIGYDIQVLYGHVLRYCIKRIDSPVDSECERPLVDHVPASTRQRF